MTPYQCMGGEAAYPVELLDQDGNVVTGIRSSACHADWLVLNFKEFDLYTDVHALTWRYRSDAELPEPLPAEQPVADPAPGDLEPESTGQ